MVSSTELKLYNNQDLLLRLKSVFSKKLHIKYDSRNLIFRIFCGWLPQFSLRQLTQLLMRKHISKISNKNSTINTSLNNSLLDSTYQSLIVLQRISIGNKYIFFKKYIFFEKELEVVNQEFLGNDSFLEIRVL